MKTNTCVALMIVVLLSGCSISASKPAPKQIAKKNGTENVSTSLDKSSTYLAEKVVPMAQLGAALRKIGKFDAHLNWDDPFIKQTITEASLLKKNERIEGPMFAKVNDVSAQVQIHIIRVDEDKYAVRALTSNKMIADAIGKEL